MNTYKNGKNGKNNNNKYGLVEITSNEIKTIIDFTYDNYIYYEYANREDSYGKTSLDFKEVIPVNKKDLPKKLEK